MIKREIFCTHDYLHFPVIPGKTGNELQIWADKDLILSPRLALTDEGGEYFFLNVKRYKNKTLTLLLPHPSDVTQKCLERIVNAPEPCPENPLYPQLYRESLRPAFHFSSRRGWLNDPNGLVFQDGVFHMYYQHNPLGTPHGGVNICWGHAVSSDLLHWKEKDDAILPWRRDWSIASGSAVVDDKNRAGYGKDAIIAAFTVLGTPNTDPSKPGYPSGGQFLAASTDGGETFFRFSHEAAIPALNGEGWRDPRLFYYNDHCVMAVYETDEQGKNCVSFYISEDFHTWRRSSRNDNLFECPDIFPLKIQGENEIRWVLYGADGMARIGDFDGYHFVESGICHPLDYGNATYAGQTWSHHPEQKRIHISWIRGMGGTGEDLGYENMPFSQCMSLPTEITLRRFRDGLHVCRSPIGEISELAGKILSESSFRQNSDTSLKIYSPAYYEVSLSDIEEKVSIRIGEHTIYYHASSGTLHFENGHEVHIGSGKLSFQVFVDTTTMELCFQNAVMSTYAMAPEFMSLILSGQCKVSCTCRGINSIWTNQ